MALTLDWLDVSVCMYVFIWMYVAMRVHVEESGMADILIDGEAAVSMAALAWMEKTPYAISWAALAAERAKGKQCTRKGGGRLRAYHL